MKRPIFAAVALAALAADGELRGRRFVGKMPANKGDARSAGGRVCSGR
jgi:hypothetical protein